ncbi:hypothetical protein PNP85_03595 [Halobacterium salinarum]|uniref:O-antigen ligase family protein n=1 Tax=Halobacterium salinarum TaxID=2242 RepID=UPI00255752C4|nr:O-antigen ligase family protein [Halobacterium salinarum]MDL0138593.1 hypothetical protein [Halobacterium salinarum]
MADRKLTSELISIVLVVFTIALVVGTGIPPIKVFGFDLLAIYTPAFLLFLSLVWVVYEGYFTINTTRVLQLTFFLYVCAIIPLIQIYNISPPKISTFISAGTIIFSFTAIIKEENHIRKIEYALIGVFVLLIVVGIGELFTGVHLPASRLTSDRYTGKYASTIYLNRNNFGFFLAIMSPIATYKLLSARTPSHISFLLVVAIVSGGIISHVNGSRAATISYIFGVITVLLGKTLKERASLFNQTPRIGSVIYIFSAAAFISLPQLISNPFSEQNPGSLYNRWELMRRGSDYILSNFKTPAGLGGFDQATLTTGTQLPGTAHNWATQLGVETGLIGLALFVISMGILTDCLLQAYYSDRSDRALPLSVCFLIFPLNGLGPSNVLYQAPIFWILVASGIATLMLRSCEIH